MAIEVFSGTSIPRELTTAAMEYLWAKWRTLHATGDLTLQRLTGESACVKRANSAHMIASGDERLTFAGDAVFTVGFDQPDWFNGFEHDPEEAARVRVELLKELAATGELLVATHLPFPSVGRVAVAGDAFRWVPVIWDY